MTPLMKFFGWWLSLWDFLILLPFAIYFGYKIIKWIIGKLKKQPQEGEIETPDVES
ncbi:MAG: hypothetical protein PHC31_07060 [Clostridia bacterium]|nr:hypothetical protein [Clostridia bacterium]